MKKLISITLCLSFTPYLFASYLKKNISEENFIKIQHKHGKKAGMRVILWDKMLEKAKGRKTVRKLKLVNDFFNKIKYMSDKKVWKKEDYWASPFEFLGVGAGDAEDYAIAKYFALRILNIPDHKLKIAFVKLTQRGKTVEHMVLNYYHKPTSVPIILDYVNKKLALATKRKDLEPIYSFNILGMSKMKNQLRKKMNNNYQNKFLVMKNYHFKI